MNTQKPDAVELLPCPFCGAEAKRRDELSKGVEGVVACSDCGAATFASTWNTRDTAERDALKAEVAAGKQWRERCEELEVVAAALYLGHDDGRMQFDIYRSLYIATADDDIMWERAALEGESR